MLVDKNGDKLNLKEGNKTVIYLDGENMFFRAYHIAIAQNMSFKHIMLNMAYHIKTTLPNHFSFAIFDGENNKDSRLKLYPEYKANREQKTDEEKETIAQLKGEMKDIMNLLGFTVYESNGIEADDVIGILSLRSISKNFNVIAVSNDKDYKQLCQYSPYINIYQHNKSEIEITNSLNFEKKYNIPIDKYVDYLSLTGDSVDNIKGVEKVGPKTAEKWVNEIGNIEDIKNNIQKLKDGKVKDNLQYAIDNGILDLNKKLISFHFHEEDKVNLKKEDILPNNISVQKLDEFCIDNNLNEFRNKFIEPLIRFGQYSRSELLQNKIKNKPKNSFKP